MSSTSSTFSVPPDRPVDPLTVAVLRQVDPLALDLAMLLRRYAEAENEARLYGPEIAVLEASGYEVDLAGPRLLGRDTARISRPETRSILLALLDNEPDLERLSRAMAREMSAVPDRVTAARNLIGQFRTGLREGST